MQIKVESDIIKPDNSDEENEKIILKYSKEFINRKFTNPITIKIRLFKCMASCTF